MNILSAVYQAVLDCLASFSHDEKCAEHEPEPLMYMFGDEDQYSMPAHKALTR